MSGDMTGCACPSTHLLASGTSVGAAGGASTVAVWAAPLQASLRLIGPHLLLPAAVAPARRRRAEASARRTSWSRRQLRRPRSAKPLGPARLCLTPGVHELKAACTVLVGGGEVPGRCAVGQGRGWEGASPTVAGHLRFT